MTIAYIAYVIMNSPDDALFYIGDLIESFGYIKGAFQYLAAVMLIMAAGVMIMFQQFRWLLVLFGVSILFIILSASNGFTPQ